MSPVLFIATVATTDAFAEAPAAECARRVSSIFSGDQSARAVAAGIACQNVASDADASAVAECVGRVHAALSGSYEARAEGAARACMNVHGKVLAPEPRPAPDVPAAAIPRGSAPRTTPPASSPLRGCPTFLGLSLGMQRRQVEAVLNLPVGILDKIYVIRLNNDGTWRTDVIPSGGPAPAGPLTAWLNLNFDDSGLTWVEVDLINPDDFAAAVRHVAHPDPLLALVGGTVAGALGLLGPTDHILPDDSGNGPSWTWIDEVGGACGRYPVANGGGERGWSLTIHHATWAPKDWPAGMITDVGLSR